MGKVSFGKLERLTKRHEFDKVLAEGKKKSIGKMFTVFSLPNGLDRKRLGLSHLKKLEKQYTLRLWSCDIVGCGRDDAASE